MSKSNYTSKTHWSSSMKLVLNMNISNFMSGDSITNVFHSLAKHSTHRENFGYNYLYSSWPSSYLSVGKIYIISSYVNFPRKSSVFLVVCGEISRKRLVGQDCLNAIEQIEKMVSYANLVMWVSSSTYSHIKFSAHANLLNTPIQSVPLCFQLF